jgi:hypothetical protein
MTSLLSECEHERDEARWEAGNTRGALVAATHRAEKAEADAARLREALADLYAAHDSGTGCRCRTSDVCPSCDRAILAREKARAALAGEQETNKGEP